MVGELLHFYPPDLVQLMVSFLLLVAVFSVKVVHLCLFAFCVDDDGVLRGGEISSVIVMLSVEMLVEVSVGVS